MRLSASLAKEIVRNVVEWEFILEQRFSAYENDDGGCVVVATYRKTDGERVKEVYEVRMEPKERKSMADLYEVSVKRLEKYVKEPLHGGWIRIL